MTGIAAAADGLRVLSSKKSLYAIASIASTLPRVNSPVLSDIIPTSEASLLRSFSSAPAGPDESPIDLKFSPEVQKIQNELMETMNKHRIPQWKTVSSLLGQCSSTADIQLTLEAIARLRTTRAVQGQQQANFNQELSKQVVNACLRVKDPQNALKTMRIHNIYGFTPSLDAAHQVLAYAREQRDSSLMQTTLKTMISNSLLPTRTTADLVLRICKDQGNEQLLFAKAKEFLENGVKFRPELYDVCVSSAANAGEVKHVTEIEKWRSKLKLPATTASTFALSKVQLLVGNAKEAAELICAQVEESNERDMYLRVLVRAWPVEVLARRRRSVKEAPLRASVEAMLQELRELGYRGQIPAPEEFATGKETIRRVIYE